MKKKYFMMVVAAIFLLATISACSNKGKSAPETDDEELVDEDEDDDADESDVALEYVSQDLGTFDLYGHVRSVEYEQAGMAEVTLRFDSKGNLADMRRTDSDGEEQTAILTRDNKGRITSIMWSEDDPWATQFAYAEDCMAPKTYISSNRSGNEIAYTYTRNDKGKIESMEREERVHFEDVEDQEQPTFTFSQKDSHGNWRKYSEKQEDWNYSIKRIIKYFADDELEQAAADEEKAEKKIVAFIKDMYNNSHYNDYDFLQKHCTERMLKHLAEEYEYDGEGYAVWLFRTSSQDSKPGSEDVGSKVTGVSKDSEKIGWYRYKFTDGGWRGENRIYVFVRDGECMIDNLERVYDEVEHYEW